jgi:glycosyltransferase involved in cell wall biosynthesis
VIKNSVCGIANLDIATGIQNKILTYMSFGLPSVCSKKSLEDSFFFKKNKNLLVYDTENQLVNSIINFITNKKLANKISNNAYSVIRKKYSWNLILSNYEKII